VFGNHNLNRAVWIDRYLCRRTFATRRERDHRWD
jgi:hypothetical protein